MDLLPSEGANSNGALMLNLESSLSSELPPLTFLADASLWFEEQQHQRRPNQTTAATLESTPESTLAVSSVSWQRNERQQDDAVVDDNDMEDDSSCSTLNTTASSTTTSIPHFSTTSVAASETPTTLVYREADRLEVARIMEQLKQGWDGTAAQPETSAPPSTAVEGIGCQYDNNTLTVDLRPLFTEELRGAIVAHHKVPMKLQFPFGAITLQMDTAKLWPKRQRVIKPGADDSSERFTKITTSANEVVDKVTGTKSWKCHLCVHERVYASRSGLASHLLAHSNRRPFKCQVCSKSFRQFGHLQSHMALHSGQKHFRCNKCASTFTQKHHLTSHQAHADCFGQKEKAAACGAGPAAKKAVGNRGRKCTSCGRRCRSIAELKKHLISDHATTTLSPLPESELCGSFFKSSSPPPSSSSGARSLADEKKARDTIKGGLK
uniref:C2H2-type domain-containing protein n=1 Tax=Plectus sambesii TaxID=2011161 RepID=A0A914UL53_9BILA